VFQITKQQQQYLTYVLTDKAAQSQIEVVPERGGIISRWRVRERDLLYLDANRFSNPELSIRGGVPILFPICGNLLDNTYTYDRQQYQLKQHGFARDLVWEVTDTETDDSASITLTLNSSEATLAVYPFEFMLIFTYQLQGDSLKIIQSYINKSDEIMPFAAGFHPYFAATAKEQLEFEIPASQYISHLDRQIYPFQGKFDFNTAEIDIAFTSIDKHAAAISDRLNHSKIQLRYSDFFSTLVFWTLQGKEYVCLEPWSAPRNALNTGKHLTHLEPGRTYSALFEMNFSQY
jgi:galactose mutarotase-like enzyme